MSFLQNIHLIAILKSLAIIALAVLISKSIALHLRRSLRERMRKDYLELLIKVTTYAILSIAILSVLPILGFNPSGLLLAGGIAGIVIGFASQSIVSNLISGFFMMVERPIRIGDSVSIGDTSGVVEDISMISTIIRTFDGLYVRVPNEKVFTSSITNFVANPVRRFEYSIGIRYSDDAEKAIEIIKRVVEEHPFVLKNPEPQAFVDELGDNAVIIKVRMWAPSTEWFGVKMELLWKIKKALEENGIEIPFPQRTLWFGNELKLKDNNPKT